MPKKRDALAVVPTDLAQQWATRINRSVGLAVEAILATGRELIEAKKSPLGKHGGWERMFRGHPQAVARPVGFSVSTAKMLMLIAGHQVLSNRQHVNALPPSWGTLYELSKLSPPQLSAALADGRIHPGMERKDVAALSSDAPSRRRARGGPSSLLPPDAIDQMARAVRDAWKDCPQELREEFIEMLHQLATKLQETL